MKMSQWLRGLALLRHPELFHDLGERRFHLLRIKQIRNIAANCKIDSDVRLVEYETGRLSLGNGVGICGGSVLAFGDARNGFGNIAIGKGTWIGEYNNLRAGGGNILVGQNCLISQLCTLVASNHGVARNVPVIDQPPEPGRSGVTIGDDVWLGAGVTVTPGVRVGTGAVLGAGSVLTKNVPDYEIWAGVPAKKIGERM